MLSKSVTSMKSPGFSFVKVRSNPNYLFLLKLAYNNSPNSKKLCYFVHLARFLLVLLVVPFSNVSCYCFCGVRALFLLIVNHWKVPPPRRKKGKKLLFCEINQFYYYPPHVPSPPNQPSRTFHYRCGGLSSFHT